MTDEQIIKALERCFTRGFDESTCYECPFYTATAKCAEDLRDSVLDLINRQKAEIARLTAKILVKDNINHYNTAQLRIAREELRTAKSEAIREFVERVKRYSFVDSLSLDGKETVYVDGIDSILKEMTEVEK